jgi:hypothetical protein
MKKRQLIFVPEVNPRSFVLLFEKGPTGGSWSVRDYSNSNAVSVRYARELCLSLREVRARAMQTGLMFDAPVVATTDLDYWHKCVTGYNRRYLQQTLPPPKSLPEPIKFKAQTEKAHCYPVLALDRLMVHSKWLKRQDREWILGNGQSEDWVTWDAFASCG